MKPRRDTIVIMVVMLLALQFVGCAVPSGSPAGCGGMTCAGATTTTGATTTAATTSSPVVCAGASCAARGV